MKTQRRLTPESVKGIVFDDDAARLRANRCSLIEDALLECGATPGVDYTYKDLMQWVLAQEDNSVSLALNSIASALYKLGLNDAFTPYGAIELLSKEIKDGLSQLSEAIQPKMEMSA